MAHNLHLLIVDDEENIRSTLSDVLSAAGYEVTTAAGGGEAIALVQGEHFDLAILDVRMPMVDGLEVLRFIKQQSPETKVIMLTAFADLKQAMEAKQYGAEDFISKPYDIQDLLATIERISS
ncbi:MAG: response regulator [Ignavibacteria bacterium]|nr:response regulator [Ignavibacteria bacterium]MBI3766293.1 response regulator [Ignavibacteriales bacterium]